MKLKECLDFGKMCGLRTIDECVRNVEIHAGLLFPYSKIEKEISELYADIRTLEPEYYAQIRSKEGIDNGKK